MAVQHGTHDIAERALLEASEKVAAVREAIRATVSRHGERGWTPRELQEEAARGHDWSSSVLSLAFWSLVDEGVLSVDDDLVVRAL